MPSTGMPSAIFASIGARLGNSCCISRARWRTESLSSSSRLGLQADGCHGLGQRALVGHREGPQLLDLVAEEVDAHRVVGDGREDVEDAAAHGELAAPGHHVDARVGEVDELAGEGGEVVAAAARVEHDRLGRSARLSASGCSAARTEATTMSGRALRHRPRSTPAGCAGPRCGGRRSRRSGSAARAAGSPTPGSRARWRRGRRRRCSPRAPRTRGSSP